MPIICPEVYSEGQGTSEGESKLGLLNDEYSSNICRGRQNNPIKAWLIPTWPSYWDWNKTFCHLLLVVSKHMGRLENSVSFSSLSYLLYYSVCGIFMVKNKAFNKSMEMVPPNIIGRQGTPIARISIWIQIKCCPINDRRRFHVKTHQQHIGLYLCIMVPLWRLCIDLCSYTEHLPVTKSSLGKESPCTFWPLFFLTP